MRKLAWLVLLAILLTGCGGELPETMPSAPETETAASVPQTTAQETRTPPATEQSQPAQLRMVFTFVGDCTFGGSQANAYAGYGFLKTVGEDYDYPFRNVRSWFEDDDFTMANLEGVLGDKGHPAEKRYTFRGPASYANILTQNSVEAVTLANNHTMDYWQTGYDETKRILDEAGLPFVEANASRLIPLENGVTVGLYGSVYSSADVETVTAGIRELKRQGADVIIYAPHWGVEHSFRQTQAQEELGRAAIDAGANIVYGCHPHVLQPIEEYHGGVIFYSLGNFSFGGNIYPGDYDTAVIQQELVLEEDGGASLGQRTIVPCSVSSIESRNNFQPTPYAEDSEAYARVLSKLDGSYRGPNLPIS